MAVQGESVRPRSLAIGADVSLLARAGLMYFSIFALSTLEILRRSRPAPDVVHIPTDVIFWVLVICVLAPALLLAATDAIVSKADPSGRKARVLRGVVFVAALALILRQLQLYFAPVASVFHAAAAVHAEGLLFAAVMVALGIAVARRQEAFRQFFLYAAPIALLFLVVDAQRMAPLEVLSPGYGQETAAGDPDAPPVFVIVMDELAYEVLDDGDGLDAAAYPNIAALAGDGAWLTNATTNYAHTEFVVPPIVDATASLSDEYQVRLYDQYAYVESMAWDSCGEVYTCRGAGHLSQEEKAPLLGSLLRRSLYTVAPSFLDGALGKATGWMQFGLDAPAPNVDPVGIHTFTERQSEEFLADVAAGPTNGTVFFYHVLLPHAPFVFEADGSVVSEVPHFDETDTSHDSPAYQRYREQTRYADALLGQLVERLKAAGAYENAVIMLTGDHGLRRHLINRADAIADEGLPVSNELTRVPLVVRAPGVRPGVYDVDYQHKDFEATLLDVLGRDTTGTEGVSAFATERPERTKDFYLDYRNRHYWHYRYDEATGTWPLVEFVDEPLRDGLPDVGHGDE